AVVRYLDAPEVNVTAAPPAASRFATATFRFSSSEPGWALRCRLDGAAWAGCTSPKRYAGLAEGQHDFAVEAGDGAGHVARPARFAWRVDLTPPETTIDGAPDPAS